MNKHELVADADFIDVSVRQENLTTVPSCPVMVQMPLQPCYGLTIHKTQALSNVGGRNRFSMMLRSLLGKARARRLNHSLSTGSSTSYAAYSKASLRKGRCTCWSLG